MLKRGFTLIEILIVLVIMAVLLGTAVLSVGTGMKSARLRDAARAVQLYTRHAKAVALLKQRPVVITFEEIMDGGEFQKSRISLAFSGDAEGGGEGIGVGRGGMVGGGGEVRTLSGLLVQDESADAAVAAADDGSAPADPLMAEPREFEGVRIHAALKENLEENRPRISVFSNVDVLLRKSADEQAKAREKEARRKDLPAPDSDEPEEERENTFSMVYEANGRCEPYVVTVYKDGTDERDGLTINVGRFGRVVTGD